MNFFCTITWNIKTKPKAKPFASEQNTIWHSVIGFGFRSKKFYNDNDDSTNHLAFWNRYAQANTYKPDDNHHENQLVCVCVIKYEKQVDFANRVLPIIFNQEWF